MKTVNALIARNSGQGGAGRRHGRAARRRSHRSVHRPLPQGGEPVGSTTRSSCAGSRGLSYLRDLNDRAAHIQARSRLRADDASARRRSRRGRFEGRGWRISTCLPPQASVEGAGCPRGGARTARRSPTEAAGSARPPRPRPPTYPPNAGSPMARRRWRGPGQSWSSTSRKMPTSSAVCARISGGAANSSRRSAKARCRRAQSSRLLRLVRAAGADAVAPRAGGLARRARGGCAVDLDAEGAEVAAGPSGPVRDCDLAAGSASPAQGRPGDTWLLDTVRTAWRTKIRTGIEQDLRTRLFERARGRRRPSLRRNLKDLLLPLRPVAGSRWGSIRATGTGEGSRSRIAPAGSSRWRRPTARAAAPLAGGRGDAGPPVPFHGVELLSIATARRPGKPSGSPPRSWRTIPTQLAKVTVSEAGASVYSASEIAARELPDLDVSHRGAASIARRLQDPLAETRQDRPEIDRRRGSTSTMSARRSCRVSLAAVVEMP